MRFGTVPILWANDDVPDLSANPPYQEILKAIQQSGFEATELGSSYPRDPEVLRNELAAHGLTLSGAYYCPGLTEPEKVTQALAEVDDFLDFLQAAGCSYLVAAEPIEPRRSAIAGRVHEVGGVQLSDSQWETLSNGLNEVGVRCQKRGLQLVFHNHAGTWVETPLELKRLLNQTDSALVGLCLDTGHYTFGGGNAVEAVDQYHRRLRYVHFKDLDAKVKAAVTAGGHNFMEALRRRVFPELGKGCVDLAGVAERLLAHGYDGWVVAEQDTTNLEPCDAAKANRAALDGLFAGGAAPRG
ncbi:MAG: Myo-inosose-2 dehydratase [Cyanobacteria bacterium RYN_339]|nr:Myo-inosose-2 dehydratase [Cyanobacteria bacterium RYN_339]